MAAPDDTATSSTADARRLGPGQTCRIAVYDVAAGASRTVHETTEVLLEAPNWTRDGRLIVNGEGRRGTPPTARSGSSSSRTATGVRVG